MTLATLKHICNEGRGQVSKRDTWIAAGIMLSGALVFSALGIWLRRIDWPVASQLALMMGFPGSYVLAMPFMGMKARSRRIQGAIMIGMLGLLLLIAWVAAVN